MHGCSTCFGTCTKSTTVLSMDQATKSQNLQRSRRRGQSLTEKDIWTSSSNDMDNFTKNSRSSQRSLSSLSTTNAILETHGANNNASSVAFVNHGLMLWNEQRRDWTGNRLRLRSSQPCESAISWTSTYEDLLGTSRPFVKPISLREMVSFLAGVWEQEGLYD